MSLGVVVLGGNCPLGSCPMGVIVLQGSFPRGSCPQGSCPRGSCPRGSCLRTDKIKKYCRDSPSEKFTHLTSRFSEK